MLCIFCKFGSSAGKRVEHILPESLGGGDWASLPPGVVCDACNQYFGSKVERVAIKDYPLNIIRVYSGVITKKKKWATMPYHLGFLEARPVPGQIGFGAANSDIEKALLDGRITRIITLAETKNPLALCRLLLKMAIETIALGSPEEALSERYDAARRFARAPARGSRWWFMYHSDHKGMLGVRGHGGRMSGSIIQFGEALCAVFQISDFSFIVPVDDKVDVIDRDDFKEPNYRYFEVGV